MCCEWTQRAKERERETARETSSLSTPAGPTLGSPSFHQATRGKQKQTPGSRPSNPAGRVESSSRQPDAPHISPPPRGPRSSCAPPGGGSRGRRRGRRRHPTRPWDDWVDWVRGGGCEKWATGASRTEAGCTARAGRQAGRQANQARQNQTHPGGRQLASHLRRGRLGHLDLDLWGWVGSRVRRSAHNKRPPLKHRSTPHEVSSIGPVTQGANPNRPYMHRVRLGRGGGGVRRGGGQVVLKLGGVDVVGLIRRLGGDDRSAKLASGIGGNE